MKRCDVCNNLVELYFDGRLAETIPSEILEHNSASCIFCNSLLAIWRKAVEQYEGCTGELWIRNENGSTGVLVTVWRNTSGWSGERKIKVGKYRLLSNLQAVAPSVEPSLHLSVRKLVSVEPTLQYYVGIISRWFSKCVAEHSGCAGTSFDRGVHIRPGRLVEIPDDLGSPLRISDEPPTDVQYVALSYCWGTVSCEGEPGRPQDRLRLFKDVKRNSVTLTYESHSAGTVGQTPHFPLTYRQAVLLAKALGFSYIWIDALCIDAAIPQDWRREMAKMKHIYAGAALVLAADQGRANTSGFLKRKRIRTRAPAPLDLGKGNGYLHFSEVADAGRIIVESCDVDDIDTMHAHFLEGGPKLSDGLTKSNPVFTRGWCLQEQLLSSRVVHFTSLELVWECGSVTQCECEGLNLENRGVCPNIWRQVQGQKSIWKSLLETEDASMAWNFWWDCVENYSSRDLSQLSDKLPAISGLAESIPERILGSYTCGLWRNTILRDLLWRVYDHKPSAQPIANIPSWSWASVPGYIQRPWTLHQALADLISIEPHVEKISVSSAASTLRLMTYIGKIQIDHPSSDDAVWSNTYGRDQTNNRIRIAWDYSPKPRSVGDKSHPAANLSCAIIGISRPLHSINWRGLSGLVLSPICDTGTGVKYRRVGCMSYYDSVDQITATLGELSQAEITIL